MLSPVFGGLVSVQSPSGPMGLVHYIAEYLLRTYWSSIQRIKLELSRVYLEYLQLPTFADGPVVIDTGMDKRLRKFPFLEYVTKH